MNTNCTIFNCIKVSARLGEENQGNQYWKLKFMKSLIHIQYLRKYDFGNIASHATLWTENCRYINLMTYRKFSIFNENLIKNHLISFAIEKIPFYYKFSFTSFSQLVIDFQSKMEWISFSQNNYAKLARDDETYQVQLKLCWRKFPPSYAQFFFKKEFE